MACKVEENYINNVDKTTISPSYIRYFELLNIGLTEEEATQIIQEDEIETDDEDEEFEDDFNLVWCEVQEKFVEPGDVFKEGYNGATASPEKLKKYQ